MLYQRYVPSTCFVTVDTDLGHLDGVVSARFLHGKVNLLESRSPLLSFPYCLVWQEVTAFKKWGVILPSSSAESINHRILFYKGDLSCAFIPSLGHLFTLLWACGYPLYNWIIILRLTLLQLWALGAVSVGSWHSPFDGYIFYNFLTPWHIGMLQACLEHFLL